MTSRLRTKRLITARPLARGKRTNRLLTAVLLATVALPVAVSHSSAAALKWRPYRKPEIRAERADAVEQPGAEDSAVTHAAPTRRNLREKIMQVAAEHPIDTDPLADPFSDGPRLAQNQERIRGGSLPLEEPSADADLPTAEEAPAAEPNPLEPLEDYFPEERIPGGQREEMVLPAEDPEFEGAPSLSDEFRDYDSGGAAPTDCKAEKADCADAFAKLKSNTLANIDLSIDIGGVEGTDFPCECPFGAGETFEGRNWSCVTYNWKASGLCHKPLYFEQVAVERYGHSAPTLVQDVLSGAHFFASIPALPYMMGLCPPDECQYSLGYYRPGNCAPYLIDPIPLSLRAGLFQAGAIAGGILIIP